MLYSVVLDHSKPDAAIKTVDLAPVEDFLSNEGSKYILGTDPRDANELKPFSVAPLVKDQFDGYMYIVLAGKDLAQVHTALDNSYAKKIVVGIALLTVFFAALLGILLVIYLTKNLRAIDHAAYRFSEGDLTYRIPAKNGTDLTGIANTFNTMAGRILDDMEKIKSLEKHRRDLIANISHDLRTPLAIIQGYIETLQMKDSSLSQEERNTYLLNINNSGQRLAKLIDQLFEYTKLEANQVVPQRTILDNRIGRRRLSRVCCLSGEKGYYTRPRHESADAASVCGHFFGGAGLAKLDG